MNSFKLRLLFCLLLACNVFAVFAQTIPAANTNIGCSADEGQPGGDYLRNVGSYKAVLPARDRKSSVSSLSQQDWGSTTTSTATDSEYRLIYKFYAPNDGASGGFYFSGLNNNPGLDIRGCQYVHVAIYSETDDQSVTVRLATSGGGNDTYNQFQVDSRDHTLKQGWNYLNIKLSDFQYYDNNGVTNFKPEQVNQIGFVFSTGNRNLYVDDIYFYTLIEAANHNIGCSADAGQTGGDALTNVTGFQTIYPAGDRTEQAITLRREFWWGGIGTFAYDNNNHELYKIVTNDAGATGGFSFMPVESASLDVSKSNYIHVAVYAETGDQSIRVRLATRGGNDDASYKQHQVDSPDQPLKAGWNYLNINLSEFSYDDNSGVWNFKASAVSQVGFRYSAGGKNLYLDDIYFYTLPISAANHNLGCKAGDGAALADVEKSSIKTVLPAGDRKATTTTLEQQCWDGGTGIAVVPDANNHDLYKFVSAGQYGTGGLYFSPSINASNHSTYLHAAVYADKETHVQIRLASPGGSDGTYNQYQVNTTEIDLKQGWNYLNRLVDVRSEDRQITNVQDGFAYYECNNTFNFNPANVHQVGFVITEADHSIYVDDVYFYSLTYSTVDNDGENINWTTDDGTTDLVGSVFQLTDEQKEEAQNPVKNAYDDNNSTYYGVSTEEAQKHQNRDNAFYFVTELAKPVTVSDVELVWGNGYPMYYEAYALESAPSAWTTDNVKPLLTADNKLFDHRNDVVSYEPYYNTTSELDKNGNQNGNTKYIVIKMWQPMGNTFGFKLNEIHVGAYDDDYYTVDHIGVPNMNLITEKYNQQPVVATPRNKRNAILTNGTISSVTYTVEDNNDRYVSLDRNGNQANVWASKPGNYVIDVDGTVDGVTVKNQAQFNLTVNRDWRGDKTNTKSMIQDLDASAFSSSSHEINSSDNYEIKNIGDGKLDTRWASGSSAASAENQCIVVKLGDDNQEFQVRDLEFLWERAYPETYAVYGLNAKPETVKGTTTTSNEGTTTIYTPVTYDEFKAKYGPEGTEGNHLLYEKTLERGHNVFPYRDLHVSGTGTDNVNNSITNSKYLLVVFKEPIQQENGDRYGVSLWELYAQAVDMTQLNKMTEITANDMTMYIDSKNNFTVQGVSTTDGSSQTVIDKLNDVTFDYIPATSTNNHRLISRVDKTTDASGATIYNLYATVDSKEVKVAEIWDAGNNTYAVKSGTDRSLGGKIFDVGIKYTNANVTPVKECTATFALQIIKKPMDLLPTSTPRNLVFNDGYYVEERLEKYASPDVLTVDLRNVDFTTDYKGESLSKTKITAPRDLNLDKRGGSLKGDETYTIGYEPSPNSLELVNSSEVIKQGARQKMNPNAVYYVSQNAFDADNTLIGDNGVHGENVALMDNRDNSTANNWYIENLRLFDGYDFAPEDPSVNPKNADNGGKIYAHNAIFYTNIPEKITSTLILPFDVRNTELSNLKFYTPEWLKKSEDDDVALITIKPFALNADAHPLANKVYVVEGQQGASTYSTTGGYAVQMVSTSYKKDNQVVEVAKAGSTTEINIGDTQDKAKLVGTFMEDDISQIGGTNYLYLSSQQNFLPANSEVFDFTKNTDNVHDSWKNKNLQNTVLPFYVYLNIPDAAGSPAKVAFFIGGETTGITSIHSNESDGIDFNKPLYDLMGRRVNKSYHGIVIQNGKKHLMK